jgi:hypothetical protein
MPEEPVTVKAFTVAGRMYCHVFRGKEDITSTVKKVVLTLEKGKVTDVQASFVVQHTDTSVK